MNKNDLFSIIMEFNFCAVVVPPFAKIGEEAIKNLKFS
jgi:hypothetical protein